MSDIHIEMSSNYIKNTSNKYVDSENLDKKKNVQTPTFSYKVSKLSELSDGLDFMLAHFTEPIWPRNVSTAATQDRQKPIYDRDRAILYYQGASGADCKLAIMTQFVRI
jgi:hypothetical protein